MPRCQLQDIVVKYKGKMVRIVFGPGIQEDMMLVGCWGPYFVMLDFVLEGVEIRKIHVSEVHMVQGLVGRSFGIGSTLVQCVYSDLN